jgi:A/G-specific adenine glycosylase
VKYPIAILEYDINFFQDNLLLWFTENKRSFPWRNRSATNYELIISEVLLQRTKAEVVSKFLPIFFKQFPSWKQLSKASEIEIQDFIKPLGLFKQRGTRLFKLAQELRKLNGRFPKERAQVEDISMMGQYLTNAYELYILKKRSPLLDVNMARLLERFFAKRKLKDIRYDPFLQTLAYRVINNEKAKELNWAILDYTSIICIKNKPKCDLCIIKLRCKYLV